MKVNARALIEITHSKRGLTKIEKTWAAIGFEWLGAKNPLLPELLKSLHETGKAQVTDSNGTTYMRLKNGETMYIED